MTRGKRVARPEDVAFPDVVSVDPDAFSQQIHHAFDAERGLVRAESSHRAAWRVVRVYSGRLHVDVRDPVHAARMARRTLEHLHADGRVGTRIAQDADPDTLQLPRVVGAHGVVKRDRVPLGMDPHRLLAREDGLDRLPQEHGGKRSLGLDGEVFFATEGASVGDELYVDAVDLNPQNACNLLLVVMNSLALRVNLDAAVFAWDRKAGLRLEKGMFDSLSLKRLLHDVRGRRECGIHIPS